MADVVEEVVEVAEAVKDMVEVRVEVAEAVTEVVDVADRETVEDFVEEAERVRERVEVFVVFVLEVVRDDVHERVAVRVEGAERVEDDVRVAVDEEEPVDGAVGRAVAGQTER